jgi:hypothetical protein
LTHNSSSSLHSAAGAEIGTGDTSVSTAVVEEIRQLIDIWVAPLLVRKFLSRAYSKRVSVNVQNRNDIDRNNQLSPTSKPE